MEYEKILFLSINKNLNNYKYYSNSGSSFNKSIYKFNHLCENFSTIEFHDFINSNEASLLIDDFFIDKIKTFFTKPSDETNDEVFEEFFNINTKEYNISENFKRIEQTRDTLPFRVLDSIAVDKRFIENNKNLNEVEIKKQLSPIADLIEDLKRQNLFIPNINITFHYDNGLNELLYKGYFGNSKLFVSSDRFNSSTFYHEYFHAMDCEISHLLNIIDRSKTIPFSEIKNYQGNALKDYRNFIDTCDQNNSTPEQTKSNLSLYFEKHFSQRFKDLNWQEANDSKLAEELMKELDNLRGGIYRDDNFKKYDARDEVVSELNQHIKYALGQGPKPDKKIFTTFSKAADLDRKDDYNATNAEKLARIYQSQIVKEKFKGELENYRYKRIFPEGSEYDELAPALNKIIESEFKPLFKKYDAINNMFKTRYHALSSQANHKNTLTI